MRLPDSVRALTPDFKEAHSAAQRVVNATRGEIPSREVVEGALKDLELAGRTLDQVREAMLKAEAPEKGDEG